MWSQQQHIFISWHHHMIVYSNLAALNYFHQWGSLVSMVLNVALCSESFGCNVSLFQESLVSPSPAVTNTIFGKFKTDKYCLCSVIVYWFSSEFLEFLISLHCYLQCSWYHTGHHTLFLEMKGRDTQQPAFILFMASTEMLQVKLSMGDTE